MSRNKVLRGSNEIIDDTRFEANVTNGSKIYVHYNDLQHKIGKISNIQSYVIVYDCPNENNENGSYSFILGPKAANVSSGQEGIYAEKLIPYIEGDQLVYNADGVGNLYEKSFNDATSQEVFEDTLSGPDSSLFKKDKFDYILKVDNTKLNNHKQTAENLLNGANITLSSLNIESLTNLDESKKFNMNSEGYSKFSYYNS